MYRGLKNKFNARESYAYSTSNYTNSCTNILQINICSYLVATKLWCKVKKRAENSNHLLDLDFEKKDSKFYRQHFISK